MKKILAGLSMLGLILGVTACGELQSSSSAGPSTPVESTPTSTLPTESSQTSTPVESTGPVALKDATLYVVGDSTVSSFNDAYYYPRYGYGTQLSNYLDAKITVNNLALSGRSSKSFLTEANYETLTSSIQAGDFLMIGFGHNDEKYDDAERYTTSGATDDTASFKYHLYNYYIKVAQDKGATPILCTPIVRATSSDDYTGNEGHVTSVGDYAQLIRDLGAEKNVTVVDLTAQTKQLYETIGYSVAIKYHAWTTSNQGSVDNTHLNIYGAKNVAYMIASSLAATTNPLAAYVKADITAPTEADLVKNPNYVELSYTPFDATSYTPVTYTDFISEGWYGTSFGSVGGTPTALSNGFYAEETSEGVFRVGQIKDDGSYKGKIASNEEGFCMAFRQVSVTKNFTITADFEVLTEVDQKQAGFGLMLRDDIYVEQSSQNKSIISNSVTAGLLTNDGTTTALFARENASLKKESNTIDGLYQTGDTASCKIERVGQVVKTEITYKGTTYTATYTDFDFVAIDNQYMYVCMFGIRGTTVQVTNVNFQITGDAIVA